MSLSKHDKMSIARQKSQMLDKLEGGINVGGADINQLYRQQLSETLNVDEPITTTIKGVPKPARPPKPKPIKKEPSERGKKASANLSKYRQQVREALELKKKIDNKNTLIYEDSDADDEDEDEEEVKAVPAPVITQPQVIMPDMSKVYNDIDALKKQNKALEERLLFRRDVLGISDMRKNMLLKF